MNCLLSAIKSKIFIKFSLNLNPMSRMIFSGQLDRYKGFHIELNNNNDLKCLSTNEFEQSLQESLKDWLIKKYRVSWFQIGLQFTHFIPTLVKFGYVFHHSKTDYVVMNKWLCESEPPNIPGYAFTNVGVGGLVIDESNRVLVVKERHFFGREQMWKFPGGYATQGEDFGQTAVREVLEETGIQCEFESVVAFRHFHKFAFDCSDIYIVCQLKVVKQTSNDSQTNDSTGYNNNELEVQKCSFEIDDCQWVPIDELKPQLSQFNLYVLQKYLSNRENGVKIGLESIQAIIKGIEQKTYSIHRL